MPETPASHAPKKLGFPKVEKCLSPKAPFQA